MEATAGSFNKAGMAKIAIGRKIESSKLYRTAGERPVRLLRSEETAMPKGGYAACFLNWRESVVAILGTHFSAQVTMSQALGPMTRRDQDPGVHVLADPAKKRQVSVRAVQTPARW